MVAANAVAAAVVEQENERVKKGANVELDMLVGERGGGICLNTLTTKLKSR